MTQDEELAMMAEYKQTMEKFMDMWAKMTHDLYLKTSTVLMSFSLVAIGYILSYLLDNKFHSGEYAATIDTWILICFFGSLGSLVGAVICGFTHLWKNLTFSQCTASHFAVRHADAIEMYHKILKGESIEQKEYPDECKAPSVLWWRLQFGAFVLGVFLFLAWVVVDFFTVGL